MIKKNFIIAWRNLLKNRLVSSINIFGLTLGLASSLLAILFAIHELNYENSHKNADRIATLYLSGIIGSENKKEQKIPIAFGPEAEAMKNMFPEVEAATISRRAPAVVRVGENLFWENHIILADSAFTSIFTVPLVAGTRSNKPETVILSVNAANKYFGNHLPLGQTITANFYGEKMDLEVTGIYENLPSNTHLRADFIVPFSLADRFPNWNYKEYQSTVYNSYLLLKKNTDFQELNNKILDQFEIPIKFGERDGLKSFIVPLKEMHFSGSFDINKGKLIVFLVGGIFVLLTSCFNYINLTNIIFATRSKEIGIRKTNGGNRRNVFMLFISDSMMSTFIAFAAAIILIQVSLPWFNSLMDTHITLTSGWQLYLSAVLLYVFTVLFSGFYPAFKYSKTKPVQLIRTSNSIREKGYSRTVLTAFQFFMAVLFIQILMVMNRQNAYLFDENVVGFSGENVICVAGHGWGDLRKVKEELLKNPSIEAVSWGSTVPYMGMSLTKEWFNDNNNAFAAKYFFEPDYLNTFQIKLKKGRFFSENYASDKDNNIVINEKTAEKLGWDDPIDKLLMVEGKQYKVIGVVDNYMAQPPIFEYMPMLIWKSGPQDDRLIIKVDPHNRQSAHRYIAETLAQFNSEQPITLKYHNEVLLEQEEGKSFISAAQLMNLFFTLTIITSLIGLFGLSIFVAQRGRKEIGIRKVLGASIAEIILNFSKGVLFRMGIAAALATPLAYVIGKGFLSIYPNNFNPGLLFFLSGAGIGLVVLALTVLWQILLVATRNPVEALRYE